MTLTFGEFQEQVIQYMQAAYNPREKAGFVDHEAQGGKGFEFNSLQFADRYSYNLNGDGMWEVDSGWGVRGSGVTFEEAHADEDAKYKASFGQK